MAAKATRTLTSRLRGCADDARGRAMIANIGLGVSGAPVVVIGSARLKQRTVPFVAIAEAPAASALAAAIVVRNDVVLTVAWVVAGADPRHRRHVRAGRAHRLRSSAARAHEAIQGAVPPVI